MAPKAKPKSKAKAKPKYKEKSTRARDAGNDSESISEAYPLETSTQADTDMVLLGEPFLRLDVPSFKEVLEGFAAAAFVPAEPDITPPQQERPFSGSWGNGRIAERFPRRLHFDGFERLEQVSFFSMSKKFGVFLLESLKRDLYLMGVHRIMRESQLLLGGHGAYCTQYVSRDDEVSLDIIFPVPGPLQVCWEFNIQSTGKVHAKEFLEYAEGFDRHDPCRCPNCRKPCLRAFSEALDLLQQSEAATPKFEIRSPVPARVVIGIAIADPLFKGQENLSVQGISECSKLWPSKLRLSIHGSEDLSDDLIRRFDGEFALHTFTREPPPHEFDMEVDSDYDSYYGDVEHIYYMNEKTNTLFVPDIHCGMDEDLLGRPDQRYSGAWYFASYHSRAQGGVGFEGSHRTFMRETMKRSFARVQVPPQAPIVGKFAAEFDVWVPLLDLALKAKFEDYELEPGRPVDLPSRPFNMQVHDGLYLTPAETMPTAKLDSIRLPLFWEAKMQILASSTTIPKQADLTKWPSAKRLNLDQWLPRGKWVDPAAALGKEFRPLLHPRRLFPDEPHDDEGYLDMYDAMDVFWGPPSYPARAELFQNIPASLREWMVFEGAVCPSPQHAKFDAFMKAFMALPGSGKNRLYYQNATTCEDIFMVEVKRQTETEVDFRLCVRPGLLLAKLLGLLGGEKLKPITTHYEWRLGRRAEPKHLPEDFDDLEDEDYEYEIGRPFMNGRQMDPIPSNHLTGQPPLFPLLSNHADPMHSQPPHFQCYPLRPEQLRSLQWMVTTENSTEPFESEINEVENCRFLPHWQIEGRLKCTFMVRGGVLADKIGYGKTATTIGLVDCTSAEAPPPPPSTSNHIPSRATLVLCPANLHVQWINEIKKFTGHGLKVVSLQTFAQLKTKTVQELIDADIVLATYRLFYSSPYLAHVAALVKEQTGRRFAFPSVPRVVRAISPDGATTCTKFEQSYSRAVDALGKWALNKLRSSKRAQPSSHQAPASKRHRLSASALLSRSLRASEDADVESETNSGSVPREESTSAWKQRKNVPLEIFWWRRIVVDEFHELLTNYPPAQIALRHLKSTTRWGLSGTPPCGTVADIQQIASFFNCYLGTTHQHEVSEDWQSANCQRWLDRCVRQNTAGLTELRCEEKIVLVQPHSAERAIYLQLSQAPMEEIGFPVHESEDFFTQQRSREHREGLLKLCSHFQLTGAQLKSSASDECEAILKKRRKETNATKAAFKRALEASFRADAASRPFDRLFGSEAGEDSTLGFQELLSTCQEEAALGVPYDSKPEGAEMSVANEAKSFGRGIWAEMRESAAHSKKGQSESDKLLQRYKVPEKSEEIDAWRKSDHAEKLRREVRALRQKARISLGATKQNLKVLEGRLRQLRFFEETIRAQRQEEAVDCPVCYEQIPLNERCILPCAHVGCMSCFMTTMATQQRCPVCRSSVQSKELMRLAPPMPPADSAPTLAKAAKYGSKIQALLEHLTSLLKADAENRIILFVQWEDLRKKIGSALVEFGIDHLTLEGNVWQRRDVIQQFQGCIDGAGDSSNPGDSKKARKAKKQPSAKRNCKVEPPRILLLSLEHSASGTHFTAANHVVLFHPMLAETPQAGAAFEMQAIGRALRFGQQRTVEVWRFVTADTLEQQITEEHSQELWQRFRAQRVVGDSSSRSPFWSFSASLSTASSSGTASCGPAAVPTCSSSSSARSSTDQCCL